jgi:hypothetical protein
MKFSGLERSPNALIIFLCIPIGHGRGMAPRTRVVGTILCLQERNKLHLPSHSDLRLIRVQSVASHSRVARTGGARFDDRGKRRVLGFPRMKRRPAPIGPTRPVERKAVGYSGISAASPGTAEELFPLRIEDNPYSPTIAAVTEISYPSATALEHGESLCIATVPTNAII